jgi:hypothetical protein
LGSLLTKYPNDTFLRHKFFATKKDYKRLTKRLNSFSFGAEITWYFAGSYLRFSACYIDEINTIRFSEKIPIDRYNKMSTL